MSKNTNDPEKHQPCEHCKKLFLGPLLTKKFSSVMKSIKPKIQCYKFPPLVIITIISYIMSLTQDTKHGKHIIWHAELI